jgi:hypothetical protein
MSERPLVSVGDVLGLADGVHRRALPGYVPAQRQVVLGLVEW